MITRKLNVFILEKKINHTKCISNN